MAPMILESGPDGSRVKIGEVTAGGLPVVLADIRFQIGREDEVGVNGVRVMDLLEVCLMRLERLEEGEFRELALGGVTRALAALRACGE